MTLDSIKAPAPKGPGIQSKLPRVGTTIFTQMSKLATDHHAINLSQGYPDFEPPEALLALIDKHVHDNNQYAPMAGMPALLEAIARKTEALYSRKTDPNTEITVTSGATEALYAAIAALVNTGDEVVMLDPAYDSYEPAVVLNGGIPVHVPLTGTEFTIDWDRLRQTVNEKTRMLILNTPHNPTGSSLSLQDIRQLGALVQKTNIVILSDEVYEHILFDGQQHQSMLRYPELAERSVVVSSFGKTYHATGWKLGYAVAPESLSTEFRKVHQYLTFCSNRPIQLALAEYLEQAPEHYLSLSDFYQEKRDFFIKHMSNSRFKIRPSPGTYFQLADYSGISEMPDTEFANWLTTETGVAAIPISVFEESPQDRKLVRFCFAKNNDTLIEACSRLCSL